MLHLLDTIIALALCHSAAEYCAPVWSRSAHTSHVDVRLNSTISLSLLPSVLHLSHGFQCSPTIEPPALRRKAATDKLVEKIVMAAHKT